MRKAFVLGSCLTVALGLAGCQDHATAPTSTPQPSVQLARSSAAASGFTIDRHRLLLPSSARMSDQQLLEATRRAIDPGDYVCPSSTTLFDWYVGSVLEVVQQEPAIFDLLYSGLAADLVTLYDALLLQTEDTPQYFGYNGEYTRVLLNTERDAKRFWDIPSDDIQLIGMHGSMLLDVERVAATYRSVFGISEPTATYYATLVRDALLASETLDGGNHPLFSFNAFAYTTFGGPVPDKIVMGDGVLAGYAALGFGDVAPQAIYAHEFAHHIQFENGYFDDPYAIGGSEAEQTRYTELMADAMSAYYLTHKRGATMNRKRVEQFLQVFFQLGDCGFDSPNHHGTPNQRIAAARFGFDVADEAWKQGHILTSAQFHALFVAEYPEIIAPDAP